MIKNQDETNFTWWVQPREAPRGHVWVDWGPQGGLAGACWAADWCAAGLAGPTPVYWQDGQLLQQDNIVQH